MFHAFKLCPALQGLYWLCHDVPANGSAHINRGSIAVFPNGTKDNSTRIIRHPQIICNLCLFQGQWPGGIGFAIFIYSQFILLCRLGQVVSSSVSTMTYVIRRSHLDSINLSFECSTTHWCSICPKCRSIA